MTSAEKITRDIETLRQSIAIGWQEIAAATSREEADGIRSHMKMCLEEMTDLYARLEGSNA